MNKRTLLGAAAAATLAAAVACSDTMGTAPRGGTGQPAAGITFIPPEEDMVTDEETGLLVVKNVVNITFSSRINRDDAEKTIASLGGEIVGRDAAVNFYQVRFKGADLSRIDAIRDKLLRGNKDVEMATRCPMSVHKNPYYIK